MKDEAPKLLADIVDSCTALVQWRSQQTFAEYTKDRKLRRAVERELEIAGEALRQLEDCDPVTAGRVEDLRRIVGLRNRLVHGYASTGLSLSSATRADPRQPGQGGRRNGLGIMWLGASQSVLSLRTSAAL